MRCLQQPLPVLASAMRRSLLNVWFLRSPPPRQSAPASRSCHGCAAVVQPPAGHGRGFASASSVVSAPSAALRRCVLFTVHSSGCPSRTMTSDSSRSGLATATQQSVSRSSSSVVPSGPVAPVASSSSSPPVSASSVAAAQPTETVLTRIRRRAVDSRRRWTNCQTTSH